MNDARKVELLRAIVASANVTGAAGVQDVAARLRETSADTERDVGQLIVAGLVRRVGIGESVGGGTSGTDFVALTPQGTTEASPGVFEN